MTRRLLLVIVVLSLLVMGSPAAGQAAVIPETACTATTLELSGDAVPVGRGPCPGVRPGALLAVEDANGCTFNFVFEGFDAQGDSTGQYIGTAGHCLGDGTYVFGEGEGNRVFDRDGRHIGRMAYSEFVPDFDDDRDFALIKVEAGVEVNPAMCHWGGPVGLLTEPVHEMVELKHFGNGLGFSATVPARTAYAERLTAPSSQWFHGAAFRGDSGSGVITADGRAVGVLVSGGFGSDEDHGSGSVKLNRLGPALERAQVALGVNFELVTAPLSSDA